MIGKIENGKFIEAYGKVLKNNGQIITNPREEDWLNAGYKRVVEGEHLEFRDGYMEVPTYEEDGDVIRATYHYEADYDDNP